jgi:hypothetical protein
VVGLLRSTTRTHKVARSRRTTRIVARRLGGRGTIRIRKGRHTPKRHRKRQNQRRDQQRNALSHLSSHLLPIFSKDTKPAHPSRKEIAGCATGSARPLSAHLTVAGFLASTRYTTYFLCVVGKDMPPRRAAHEPVGVYLVLLISCLPVANPLKRSFLLSTSVNKGKKKGQSLWLP